MQQRPLLSNSQSLSLNLVFVSFALLLISPIFVSSLPIIYLLIKNARLYIHYFLSVLKQVSIASLGSISVHRLSITRANLFHRWKHERNIKVVFGVSQGPICATIYGIGQIHASLFYIRSNVHWIPSHFFILHILARFFVTWISLLH